MSGLHTPPSSCDRVRRCHAALICSAVVLCALVIGCSGGSGGGTSNGLQDQLDMANDQVASLRAQVETLSGRAEITPEELASIGAQLDTLRGRADISPEDLASLRDQVEELRGRADITPEALARLRDQVESLMGGADITPEALARLRDQVEELQGRADITPAELARLRDQVEELSGRADITPEALARLRAQVEELSGRADISPEDLASLRDQVEELSGRADITPEALARLRAQIETLMGRANITPAELTRLRAQIEELRDQVDTDGDTMPDPGDTDGDMAASLENVLMGEDVEVEGTGASRDASDFSLAGTGVEFVNEGGGIESFSTRVDDDFGGFGDDTYETLGLWADGVAGFVVLSGSPGRAGLGVDTAIVGRPVDPPVGRSNGRASWLGAFTGIHMANPGIAFNKTGADENTGDDDVGRYASVMGNVRLDITFDEDGEASSLRAVFDNFIERAKSHAVTLSDVDIGRRGSFTSDAIAPNDPYEGSQVSGQFYAAGDGENAAGTVMLRNGAIAGDGALTPGSVDVDGDGSLDAAAGSFVIDGIFVATE